MYESLSAEGLKTCNADIIKTNDGYIWNFITILYKARIAPIARGSLAEKIAAGRSPSAIICFVMLYQIQQNNLLINKDSWSMNVLAEVDEGILRSSKYDCYQRELPSRQDKQSFDGQDHTII